MKISTAAVALVLLTAPAVLGAQEPAPPVNLHVLPSTMTRAEVVARMRDIASALGVQCLYCHEGTTMRDIDYASDARPTKLQAREMMRFTQRVNHDLATVFADRGGASIDCITCHRGATRPQMLEDTLGAVLDRRGFDAAVAAYDSLRARYYGRFAYDFGQRSLNTLATRRAASGDLDTALRLLELNRGHFPASWDIPWEMGQLLERAGRTQEAIAEYEKVIALRPTHTAATARLAALRPR